MRALLLLASCGGAVASLCVGDVDARGRGYPGWPAMAVFCCSIGLLFLSVLWPDRDSAEDA